MSRTPTQAAGPDRLEIRLVTGDGKHSRHVAGGGERVHFDGLLHNRHELAAELGVTGELPAAALAGRARGDEVAAVDRRLATAAWWRWGEGCLRRFVGPFGLIAHDPWRRRLVAARDGLGERGLCYHLAGDLFVAAADEAAVLDHPAVPQGEDEDTLLRFLAVEPPRPGATFHAHVREVPPGNLLRIDASGYRLERWYRPLLDHTRRDDGEWAEIFAAVLDQAVASALDGTGGAAGRRAGVMMSGGLDSGSVAMVARRHADAGLTGLPVFTWRFRDLTACDEGPWVDALVGQGGLDPHPVPADDAWPLWGELSELTEVGRPSGNAYRPLKQRLYAAARDAGVDVLLTGAAGDLLWSGGRRGWLASLLAERRWGTAASQVGHHLAAGRTAELTHGVAGLAGVHRRRPARPWLRPEAAALATSGLSDLPTDLVEQRFRALAGARVARGTSGEAVWARRAGIELRDPFRDRRLVELALSLPSHLLHRDGLAKYLLRRALRGVLPDEVRRRRGSTSLLPLFLRGAAERERDRVGRLLADGVHWRRWVSTDWMDATLADLDRLAAAPAGRAGRHLSGVAGVALWHCLSIELWANVHSVPEAASPAPNRQRLRIAS